MYISVLDFLAILLRLYFRPPAVNADGRGGRPTSPQRYMYVAVPVDDTKPPPKRRTHKK